MNDHNNTLFNQNVSYYNEIASDYDRILDDDESNRRIREVVAQKFSGIVKEGLVLDFGAGTGKDLYWLTKQGYEIIFCEPSVAMRQIAIDRNNDRLNYDKVVFLEGSNTDFRNWAVELPFDQKADGILCNFAVINCIGDISTLFRSLALVTKPGASVLILMLDSSRKTLWKSHLKNAAVAFIFGRPISISISFKDVQQRVQLHTIKQIKRAAGDLFDVQSHEMVEGSVFSVLHLVRK